MAWSPTRWSAVAAPLLLAAVAGCAPAAPEGRVLAPLTHGVDVPLFLTAPRQREAIARALRGAGFTVAEQPTETPYFLRVTLGIDQGTEPCGTLHNVRYVLRAEGRNAVEVEAKGWTGTCQPNVFEAASRTLRQRMLEAAREETPR